MDARLFSRNGEVLARAAEGNNVNRFNLSAVNLGHIAKVFHVRETVGRHTDWEVLNLAGPYGFDTIQGTGKRESAGAVKKASEFHAYTAFMP